MQTWHQAGLIKCILRPLKTLQRAHLSWLIKLPGSLCSCLPVLQAACDCWLLVPPSPFPVSPGHALSTLRVSDLFIDFISFQIIMPGCSCVVYLGYLLHEFFSGSVPLIFYHHTHLHTHLNTCCGCKPIIHFHPKGFPYCRGISACLCTAFKERLLVQACTNTKLCTGKYKQHIHPVHIQLHGQQGTRWTFSQRDLCQFSFHYSTEEVNPHYHNKLYFYRQVQTEAAFQGIRLNFIWPPVFLGNTILPQLPHAPHFIFLFGGGIWNMLLTQYQISAGAIHCYFKRSV